MTHILRLVGRVVDAERREEILGDLTELRGVAPCLRFWWDVASICLRAPKARSWAAVGLTAGLLALLTFGGRPAGRHTVVARDPAGSFALVFEGRRVVAAALDGAPVPPDRLVLTEGRLVIRGGAGDQDLDIELHPDGTFFWQGRSPRPSSPQ